jgi:uncharacterized protein (TIGR02588 family)
VTETATESPERAEEDEAGEAGDGASAKTRQGPDWLEQLASWVSGLLVLALAVFLAWDAIRTHAPASVSARGESPRAAGGHYQLPIVITNDGDEPAQDVLVHVELRGGSGAPVEADLTLDWLAGKSHRRVVAVLPADPALSQLRIEVRGFVEP